jgi:hypothetical protein
MPIARLVQNGQHNVVATMGADCSEKQAELIVSLVKQNGRVWIRPSPLAIPPSIATTSLLVSFNMSSSTTLLNGFESGMNSNAIHRTLTFLFKIEIVVLNDRKNLAIFRWGEQATSALDDLLAQATHYAEFCMRNSGKMSPTLFLIGADGPLMFVPASLADADEKDDFAMTARLMCIAHAATATVMTMEAWMKSATLGEKLDMTEPPSEAFDRREVVVLMGESRDGQKQKFLPIIRSDNGKFFGFGESDVPGMDKVEGRFAQILAPKAPDAKMRLLAQAMLKVKGVKIAQAANAPRLSRGRR